MLRLVEQCTISWLEAPGNETPRRKITCCSTHREGTGRIEYMKDKRGGGRNGVYTGATEHTRTVRTVSEKRKSCHERAQDSQHLTPQKDGGKDARETSPTLRALKHEKHKEQRSSRPMKYHAGKGGMQSVAV